MQTSARGWAGPRRLLLTAVVSLVVAGMPAAALGAVERGDVRRLAGDDRYRTAAVVARDAFPDGAGIVYLATGATFPDALAAAAAAGVDGAPVLLTEPDRLSVPGLAELAPEHVVVVGGPEAISEEVVEALPARSHIRLAGNDRYATAVAVAARPGAPSGDTVVLATGRDYPDALTGATLAADLGAPLLLATPEQLPAATALELRRRQPGRVVLVGGGAALGAEVEDAVAAQVDGVTIDRIAGANRYATAGLVAEAVSGGAADTAWMASGRGFPDALAAAPAAVAQGVPLLLTDVVCQPAATYRAIEDLGVSRVTLVGGVRAVRTPAALPTACSPVAEQEIATGLQAPWGVAFTPEGAYVTERDTGRLLLVDAAGAVREVQRIAVDPTGEGGLLGLAASPDYAEDGLLYAYRTTAADNEVIRFTPGAEPEVVVDGIPSASNHNGGRIAFGPDGMLWVATGDAGVASRAQDPGSLAGKVLRYNSDGGVPDDNPTPGSPVYTLGHRNVEGFAYQVENGSLGTVWSAEFGPDRDDEINELREAANYGWPAVTGHVGHADYVDPLFVRQPTEASWSGLAYIEDSSTDWEHQLVAASLRGQRLWRFARASDGGWDAAASYVGTYGRLRTVVQAPDGSVWLLTSNRDRRGDPGPDDDRIIRVGRPMIE